MNIFVLSEDPIQAARDQCNKHVVKMVIETAQLLSTAMFINHIDCKLLPYEPTHIHHPSTLWTAQTLDNAAWLLSHGFALAEEYTKRYNKVHKSQAAIENVERFINGDPTKHTPFALAMPHEWKSDDAVQSYRAYYIAEKSRFAKWRPRAAPPVWWPFLDGDA